MLHDFVVAKLRFRLLAEDDIEFPAYKGSTFRGGFGRALKKMAPSWYPYFFDPASMLTDSNGKSRMVPRPYVLLPPLDTKRTYPKGQEFSCELTLFGQAAFHFALCQSAIEFLGRELGLGHRRGRFKVLSMEAAIPEYADSVPHGLMVRGDEIADFPWDSSCECVTIRLITRLRLKNRNVLVRDPPEFPVFFQRLVNRLCAISMCFCGAELVNAEQRQRLIELANTIRIREFNVRWDDWSRFSGSQKRWMKFGGLLGAITYEGPIGPFIPYLALGQWCHVGGKTSFGLGKYVMEV